MCSIKDFIYSNKKKERIPYTQCHQKLKIKQTDLPFRKNTAFLEQAPSFRTTAPSVDSFKAGLELFKTKIIAAVNRLQVDNSNDFYWNISTDIINRIEIVSYFNSRDNYKTVMIENPWVAAKLGK